ncbi:MAG: MotA/TolQ/ExbB proton channel family protein [Stygiobacter sp.]|jgi:biopolymer transport protein ExbB|uniref:MotA/TolQ/ExbB proton channel family protein n=1 Tax=Stygiobacter electus TaxID=3032292 RepID=A0AAE3NXJ7_9BACT|nr:MotA/TolQ/ExbB proton channel family protein [Stygiobacter electus]MDF1610572.1 MotA/TolQ/ExbB proton channel family protein [Stygiobacter electus]
MNLIEMFFKGGTMMWPILIGSIIAVAITIEKFISIKKSKVNVTAFTIKIRTILKKKDIAGAINYCLEEKTPIANIIRRGLKKYKFGRKRVTEAIEAAGKIEIGKMEKGLSTLATIAGAAPMLGFLGTVTGMISAFMRIQELQGSASPADLAGGIWEALITTAFGLIVGIPALALYNYFLSIVNKNVLEMERIANEILDVLDETENDFSDDEEIEE